MLREDCPNTYVGRIYLNNNLQTGVRERLKHRKTIYLSGQKTEGRGLVEVSWVRGQDVCSWWWTTARSWRNQDAAVALKYQELASRLRLVFFGWIRLHLPFTKSRKLMHGGFLSCHIQPISNSLWSIRLLNVLFGAKTQQRNTTQKPLTKSKALIHCWNIILIIYSLLCIMLNVFLVCVVWLSLLSAQKSQKRDKSTLLLILHLGILTFCLSCLCSLNQNTIKHFC